MNQRSLELTKLFRTLKKRAFLLLGISLLGALLAGGASYFFIKPIYQLESNFLLRDTANQKDASQELTDVTLFQKLMQTYLEIAELPTVPEKTEAALAWSPQEQASIKKVSVSNKRDSQLITIQVQGTDPDLLNTYIHKYVAEYKSFTSEKFGRDNLQIVSEATGTGKPVAPHILRNALVGGGLLLFIGLHLVLLIEILSDRIGGRDELEDLLGLPVLGSIPVSKKN